MATQSKASVKKTMKRDMIRGKGQDDRTDVVEELFSAQQIRLQQNPDFCNSRIYDKFFSVGSVQKAVFLDIVLYSAQSGFL